MKIVQPSVRSVSFTCPHCHALAAQQWHSVRASAVKEKPYVQVGTMADFDLSDIEKEQLAAVEEFMQQSLRGLPFFDGQQDSKFGRAVQNINLSQCYSCKRLSIWVHDKLIWPAGQSGAVPNEDLTQDIQADMEEARAILDRSPRGAAALLRLALQKLCVQLGEPGKNIDKDIANLVGKGLDPHLQRAFDFVRVVGNEAVHPGTLDLRDDRATAVKLIDLINIVAQQLITNRRVIDDLYAQLPKAKRDGIAARDAATLQRPAADAREG